MSTRTRTNRKQQREELQSTWNVLEPKVPGTPFVKAEIQKTETTRTLLETARRIRDEQ